MIPRVMIPLTACLLMTAALPAQEAAQQELDKLQGDWSMVSMEVRGKQAPEQIEKGSKMTVKGDRMTVLFNGKESKATIKIDPSKDPKTIDVTFVGPAGKESLNLGIYKLEGDKLILCRALAIKGRPKEFKTTADAGYLTVWKRAGK